MEKEIEIKLGIDERTFNKLIKDDSLGVKFDLNSHVTLNFKSIYYDTSSFALFNNNIAFRIRNESNKIVSTIKWNDESDFSLGFYKRNEINALVKNNVDWMTPNLSIFKNDEIGEICKKLVKDEPLEQLFEVNHRREVINAEIKDSIFSISYDLGKIVPIKVGEKMANKETIISELEIELLTGSEKLLMKISNEISEKYKLKPIGNSKFIRGINLIK